MDVNSLPLEKLDELFGEEPFGPVEEELFKWFMFAYHGKGKEIKNLNDSDIERFKNKLEILINGVYLEEKFK